jgi:hypothetical protein
MIRAITLSLFAVCLALAAPAFATSTTAGNGPDYAERLQLATKMHEIRPAKDQVEQAVSAAANRLPQATRADFVASMMKSIDVAALEKQSIEVMAQTFSKVELEKMIGYFGSPEAKVIAEKLAIYQAAMNPVIVQMLDKAAMEARTGAAGTKPAPAP